MKHAFAIALVLGCKSESSPPQAGSASSAPPPRAFGVLAEIRGDASLVPGARRFALRVEDRWYDAVAGKLVENKALTVPDATDLFLGATPIAVVGAEHREQHVRLAPARAVVPLLGVATKVEATRDGLEVWAYTHELENNVALVRGTTITYPKPFARIGPLPESMSPVSAKLCEQPHASDVAASDRAVFVLVTECGPLAPLRLAEFANEHDAPKDTQLATRRDLGLSLERLVVSRSGRVHVVGVRDKRLALDALVDGNLQAATSVPVSRVLAAVAADDEAVWTLVIDGAGKATILRDGTEVPTAAPPTALAVDDILGVVVLAGNQLYAERPGPRVVITR